MSKFLIKAAALATTLVAGIAASIAPAHAVSVSLAPGNFSILQGTGAAINNPATNGINTATPPSGFGTSFTAPFLLLGASASDTDATNTSYPDLNSAAGANVNFTNADLSTATRIDFNWAFQGDASGTDSFIVRFFNPSNNKALPSLFTRTTYGSGLASILLPANYFTTATNATGAGTYSFRVTLNEAFQDGSDSAAGFSSISIQSVPFEFSPTWGVLALGGLWGANQLRKKSAAKKEIAL